MSIGTIEVKATQESLEALAQWLEVPCAFLARQDGHLQGQILNYLCQRSTDDAIFRVTNNDLLEVRSPRQEVLDPRAMVSLMQKKVDDKADVISFQSDPSVFRLDTVVPDGFDRHVFGDVQVNDITKGGVRIIQNRKMNHAPALSEFYYRLVCTNGMEVCTEGDKIDARGLTNENVMAEMELKVNAILGRLDERMTHFYDMRSVRVPAPEQALFRLTEERGLSRRVAASLAMLVPSITDEDGTVSEFDLINLVTNYANEATVTRREGSRLLLERAGGGMVYEHASRCAHCQSKLAG